MFLFLTLCIYHKRGMPSPVRKLTPRTSPLWLAVISLVIACGSTANAQDWFKTETSTGASNIRIAVADFKAASTDGQTSPLKRTFDATLYSDLASAGRFKLKDLHLESGRLDEVFRALTDPKSIDVSSSTELGA